jgi:hypothetical protein
MADFHIDGSWTLGATVAGTGQLFPLAAQRINIADSGSVEFDLINIAGFTLLPMGELSGITVPIPELQPDYEDPKPIEFGTGPVLALGDGFFGLRWNGIGVGGDIANGTVEGRIPLGFKTSTKDVEITVPLDLSSSFKVALAWHNRRLKLKITRGADPPKYHSL